MLPRLIMLAGFFRSGSTWIGKLLDTNPSVIYRHEPLGRLQGTVISDFLMKVVKFDRGLTALNRGMLINTIISAHPAVDRPPFFKKQHLWLPLRLRFALWAIANQVRAAIPVYRWLLTPKIAANDVLVIKETGWSIHLESIFEAFNADLTCFLIRHPCAIVASIIRGLRLGIMDIHDRDTRRLFVSEHSKEKCILETGIDQETILKMDDCEYYALRWRAYYDICFRYHQESSNNTKIIVYEDFQKNPHENMVELFSEIQLPIEKYTGKFLDKSISHPFDTLGPFDKDSRTDYYSVYREAGYDARRWERTLTSDQIQKIRTIIGNRLLSEFWKDG